MAKLILVIDVPGKADLLAADMANNGNIKITVKSNSGRRASALVGQYGEAPYSNVFEGPKTVQVEAAFVSTDDAGQGRIGPVTDHISGKRLF